MATLPMGNEKASKFLTGYTMRSPKDKLLIYLEGEKIDRTVLLGKTPEIR